MLDEYLGEKVVIDLKSAFVCLGTLIRADDQFLEMKRSRRRVLLSRAEVVAVSRLTDVRDD